MLYGQVSALWIIKREKCESFITLILGIILQIEGFQNPKLGQKSPNFIIAHLFGYIPHIKLDFWGIRVICKKGSLWVHLSLLGMQKLLDSLHLHLTPLPLNAIRFETNFHIRSKHELQNIDFLSSEGICHDLKPLNWVFSGSFQHLSLFLGVFLLNVIQAAQVDWLGEMHEQDSEVSLDFVRSDGVIEVGDDQFSFISWKILQF